MSLEPIKLEKGQMGKGMLGWWQRLDYRTPADYTQADQKVWVVDVTDEWAEGAGTNGTEAPEREYAAVRSPPGYRAAYCFSDVEWLPADFESLNYRTCRDPRSIFVQMFMMTKPILNDDGTNCVGQLTLVKDELSRTMMDDDHAGKCHEKEVLAKCTTEEERVAALKEWFGIELTGDEIRGIHGLASEIRDR